MKLAASPEKLTLPLNCLDYKASGGGLFFI